MILDRPLYSSAMHVLATLKWVLYHYQKAFSEMYLCIHKCLNGLVEHDMNFTRNQELHH